MLTVRTEETSMKSAQATDSLTITGGKPLYGEVSVRGAKNTLPKNLVATLLTDGESTLRNVADIQDVRIVTAMIEALGGEVSLSQDGTLRISTRGIHSMDEN